MKTNFKRKIALSGLALGIAALSLTTTSYAWLTSNTVAKTTDVSGKTDIDSNLYVKGTKDEAFSNTATFNIDNGFMFKDVQATGEATFTGVDGTTVTATDANSSGILMFSVEFQGEALREVGITGFTVTEDATLSAKEFTLKAAMGNKNIGDKVTVALKDALAIQVGTANYMLTENTENENDAAEYYKNLTGAEAPTGTALNTVFNPTKEAPVKLATIGNNDSLANEEGRGQSTKVSFYVYLNGLDKDCFDAISNQKISINFEFGYMPLLNN